MNNDDPFGNSYIDDDKTILRPMPGGGRRSQAQVPPSVSMPSAAQLADGKAGSADNLHLVGENAGNNPFVGAAITLLSLVAQLRNTAVHADVAGLRAGIIEEVKRFDSKIRSQNIAGDQAQAARYALCTLLDETVLNTPWGCNSIWSTNSLLIYFHKEAVGGEKFFLILKNCLQQPGSHLDLLELLFFCLCLGFEGRYRNEDHGLSKLEDFREKAYQTLQRQRGDVDRELSLHWQGAKDKRNVLARLVPLWVIASVGALVLMLSYIGFLYGVNTAANPVLSRLYLLKDSLDVPPVTVEGVVPAIEPVTVAQDEDIRVFLQPEVDNKQVAILNRNGKTVVQIISKGFFASASDKIQTQYYPLLDKISQALSKISGRITIVGHTDSDQIISAKFLSNWELSKARALSVEEVLINNNRITATLVTEGRADTQPMVANDSVDNKAMNRRVEIIF